MEWLALIGGLASQTLNRVTFDGKGGADAGRAVGRRPPRSRCRRGVRTARVWLIEDANPGGLFRVTPK